MTDDLDPVESIIAFPSCDVGACRLADPDAG
jgi:hypothetical protein